MIKGSDLVRRVFASIQDDDTEAVTREVVAENFRRHDLGSLLPEPQGPAGVTTFLADLRAALPDLRITILEAIDDGERSAVRFVLTGTHTGADLLGVAATGARLAANGINTYLVEAGKLVESWQLTDGLAYYRALGLLPGRTSDG